MAPIQPELEVKQRPNGVFQIGEDLQARCFSRDGRPASQLSWFIEEEQIYETLGMPEVAESLTEGNTTLYTSSQILTRRIQSGDDRKHLVCRATSIAGPPQEARFQIQVRCKFK